MSISFMPSQYEHVASGDEEHYSYTSQTTAYNNGEHYTSSLQLQPHETAALDPPPISPIPEQPTQSSRNSIQDNRQSLQPQQDDDDRLFNQPSKFSRPTQSLECSDSNTNVSTPSFKKKHKGSWVDGLGDWWWWELASVLLSVSCLIAITAILLVIQDKPLSSWHSIISPNTLIFILATISKASLLLVVAACISQLKWLYLESAPHSLHSIQIFDNASRGPLGALELLTDLRPQRSSFHKNNETAWAVWASILTILALALDPFAQQILSFPLRTVPDSTVLANILTSQVYDTGAEVRKVYGMYDNPNVRGMAMQAAVQNGLYNLNSPLQFKCTSSNCTWPVFYTIGICNSCTDVTQQTNVSCSPVRRASQSCNYILPSGQMIRDGYYTSSGGGGRTILNVTGMHGELDWPRLTEISDWLVDVGIVLLGNNSGKDRKDIFNRPEAFQCRLSWCAKRYTTVEVDGADFDGPNRTFTVSTVDHAILSKWLASLFTTFDLDTVAQALWLQANIPQTFANIATSMTNKLREGPNSTAVAGVGLHQETYIHVTWVWLILPGVVVLMGAVLLAASIVLSRGDKEGLWKNSILATVLTQMRGWEHKDLRVGT